MKNKVISPPKAGRTWLKAAFGKLYAIQNNESDIKVSRHARNIAAFSHKIKSIKKYDKILFLVREPKDLLVSSYFQFTYRQKFDVGTISEFIKSEYTYKIIMSYLKYDILRDKNNFKLVKYEALVNSFNKELKDILNYFSINFSNIELEQVVKWCSFSNLRYLSENCYFDSPFFNPIDPGDNRSFKFREGIVGGYIKYLSKNDINHINSLCEKLNFDYESL